MDAKDALSATVSATDGQKWSTEDGGKTGPFRSRSENRASFSISTVLTVNAFYAKETAHAHSRQTNNSCRNRPISTRISPARRESTKLFAAQDAKDDSARKQPATTTEKDQVDLAVTVYNSNIALVRDVRQIHLPSGSFPLHFEDVAASINPATVHFRSLVEPAKLNVIEQNYEYDLLDPAEAPAEICRERSHACARGKRRRLHEMGGNEGHPSLE